MSPLAKIRCKKSSPGRIDAFGNLLINYSLERPFDDWSDLDLYNCYESVLSHGRINLEICTLIINELKDRRMNTSEMISKLQQYGGKVIPWLKGARHRIQHHVSTFEASGKHPRNCKVYLILLTEDRETPKPWGIYVGQTSKKIEKRLVVHLEDGNPHGSRKVRARGWQLLYSLCSLIPPLTLEDSCRLEGLLLDSLGGELKFKTLKKLPAKKVKGAGPKQYRIKNQHA
jgi:hypothetical protein